MIPEAEALSVSRVTAVGTHNLRGVTWLPDGVTSGSIVDKTHKSQTNANHSIRLYAMRMWANPQINRNNPVATCQHGQKQGMHRKTRTIRIRRRSMPLCRKRTPTVTATDRKFDALLPHYGLYRHFFATPHKARSML